MVYFSFLIAWLLSAGAYAQTSPDMSYAQLEQIIRDNNVRSVDQLIPLLPQKLRENYTFIYASRSAQAPLTSPEAPRTLLASPGSTFVLTFTRAPGSAAEASDTIETIQWNAESARFEFRELVFDGVRDPLENVETNPSRCLSCHGQDPRPNWDPYSFWPGVFGSVSLGCDQSANGTPEARYYAEFMRTGRQSGRYRHLPAEHKEDFLVDRPCVTNAVAGRHPNTALTREFQNLNRQRIARMIRSSPSYSNYRFLVQALAKGCLSPETFGGMLPPFLRPDMLTAVAAIGTRAEADFDKRLSRLQNPLAPNPPDGANPNARLNFSFGQRAPMAMFSETIRLLGIPWDQMTLAFTDGTFDFSTPGNSTPELMETLLGLAPLTEPLRTLSCEQLKTESLAALTPTTGCQEGSASPLAAVATVSDSMTTIAAETSTGASIQALQVCLRCHGAGHAMGGFSMVLEPPSALANDLRENPEKLTQIRDHLRGFLQDGTPVTRMPLRAPPLDQATQDAVIRDLELLRARAP